MTGYLKEIAKLTENYGIMIAKLTENYGKRQLLVFYLLIYSYK